MRSWWIVGLVVAILLVAFPSLVFADDIRTENQVVVAGVSQNLGGSRTVTITAGQTVTVTYFIQARNGDNQNGCNASDGTPAVVTFQANSQPVATSGSAVIANVASLVFTACGQNNGKSVTFSSITPGTYTITVLVSDSCTGTGCGTYDASAAAFTLQVNAPPDSTPPVIVPTVSGTMGNNGWYVTDVTVSWSVTDPESAITGQSGCTTTTINYDTVGTTLTCTATSAGGTSSPSVTIKRDATPPVIACTGPDPSAWYPSDVSVSCSASDATSGVASTSDVAFSLSTSVPDNQEISSASTASRTVVDRAGNAATVGPYTFRIDKKAPQVSCILPDQATWYAENVNVSCTASDDGSGLADSSDASFVLSTTVAVGQEDAAASTGTRTVSDRLGHSTPVGPFTFKVDRKAPTAVCAAPPAPLTDDGWYGDNVEIVCTASDDGSGIAGPSTITLRTSVPTGEEDAAASTGSLVVTDVAGNVVTVGPFTFKVDRAAPAIACVPTSAPLTSDGWYGDNVAVSCTASDGGSGLATAGFLTLTTSVPDGSETDTAQTSSTTVADRVGNTASVGPFTFKVDRKDPEVQCSLPDQSRWYGTNVGVSCTARDQGAGLAEDSPGTFSLETSVPAGEETASALTNARNVADRVGHQVTIGPYSFMVDRKAPTVSCSVPDQMTWYPDNVTVTCNIHDDGSGLADGAPSSSDLSTVVGRGEETASAETDQYSVSDRVGNSVTVGPFVFKVDRKGPVVALSCPTEPILQNVMSVATWSAADGGSGVAGSSSGGVPVDTATVGSRTLTLPEGFVRDNVGNPNTAVSCSYIVIYRWSGFFAPVDNPPVVNVAKAGSAIPLKFSLNGYQGMDILGAGSPKGVVYSCSSAPTDELTETTTAGASGLQYDPTTDQYIYVWKTNKSWVGKCYKLVLTLKDGTTHEAYFRFK